MNLVEWGSVEVSSLTSEQVTAIAASHALSIVPAGGDSWRVTAKQYVGTLQIPGMTINIAPKLPVARLLELLCEVVDLTHWSNDHAQYASAQSLLATTAESWCQSVERLMVQGLQKGYKSLDDTVYGIRGRVRLHDQISRHSGMALPVEVSYDEYTLDILENQILAGACRVLLLLPVSTFTRKRLQKIATALMDVTPLMAGQNTPEPTYTRINLRYKPSISLSQLILAKCSLEKSTGVKKQGAAFLVDMNRVFEEVTGEALKASIEKRSDGKVKLQHSATLDSAGTFRVRPDFILEVDGAVKVVADFKYKLPEKNEVAIADIYQALAYSSRFSIERVFLIYPEPMSIDSINVVGKVIEFASFDIGQTKAKRADSIDELTEKILPTIKTPIKYVD